MNHFKKIALASIAAMSLYSCQKDVIKTESDNTTSKTPAASEKGISVVWGLGSDNRVYRWNSSSNSWNEPSPTARLNKISVGQDNAAAVWGVASDGRIYKWNGSSFFEPNSGARLSDITAYSSSVAFGLSSDTKIIFKTTDGGVNWTTVPLTGIPYNGIATIKSISTMNGTEIVAVMSYGEPYKYNGTAWSTMNAGTSSMNLSMASGGSNGCWAIRKDPNYNLPYGEVLYHNGSYWTIPNSAARLATVSKSDENVVWGTGGDYRVYRWNASTNSWDEPNPAAGLKAVSSGN